MKQFLLFIFFSFFSLLGYAAISADVDRTQVGLNETFTLTLTANGDSPDGEPDLSILEKDFEVNGTSQSSQYSITNGHMNASKSYVITLAPKHTGNVSIPAITWGNETTQAISLTVSNTGNAAPFSQPQGQAPSNTNNDKAFFEARVDNPEVYVQGQIIYTQRFYFLPNLLIRSADPEPLNLKDALVEPLDKKWQQFEQDINGVTYNVLETHYAIYPQVSGKLTIPPQMISVEAGGSVFSNPQTFKFSSEENRINVLPPAAALSPWLPAKELQLSEKWSTDPAHLKVGDSVTRTITIEAEGLSSSQLPPLQPTQLEHVKIYPDQPQLLNTPSNQGIHSTRIDNVALVPTEAGDITLPEIKLSWWDTKTNQVKSATLAARTLHISPNAAIVTVTQPAINTSTLMNTQPPPVVSVQASTKEISRLWYIAITLLTILLIVISFLWWLAQQKIKKLTQLQKIHEESLTTSADFYNQTETALFEQLLTTCQNNDAKMVRTALLSWLKQLWHTEGTLGVHNIMQREPSLAPLLNEIDTALYDSSSRPWQMQQAWLEELKEVRLRAKEQLAKTVKMNKKNVLAPLYPNS
jgi:hypothetical protein